MLNVQIRMRSPGSQDKQFTWKKIASPSRVTLFGKQGDHTLTETLLAEASLKLSI